MRPAPQPELRERRRYPMQVNLRKQLEKMLVAVHLAFIAFIHPTASSPPAMKSTADSSKSRSRSKSIQRTEKHREAESASSNAITASATAVHKQGAACARRRRQELAEGETPFWEDEQHS